MSRQYLVQALTESLEVCEAVVNMLLRPGGVNRNLKHFLVTQKINRYEINCLIDGGLMGSKAIKSYTPHVSSRSPYAGGTFEVNKAELNPQTKQFLNRLERQGKISEVEKTVSREFSVA